jgi:phosphatidylglycerophosphatase A
MSMPDEAASGHVPASVAWSRVPLLPRLLATAGGVGFIKPAPGTWGTAAAVLIAMPWILTAPADLVTPGLLIAVLMATIVGVWSAGVAGRCTGIADPGAVVIDEVAGVWATPADQTPTMVAIRTAILAFSLFRLFDIVKPWPIAALEHLPGGWGVMADDLAAGLLAGILAGAALR